MLEFINFSKNIFKFWNLFDGYIFMTSFQIN